MEGKGALLFDVVLGALVFLGTFVPLHPPRDDEPEEVFPALWKKRLVRIFRYAGLALLLLSLGRLLGL